MATLPLMPDPAVSPDDIAAALRRTRHHLRRTPVLAVDAGELGLPTASVLKLELLQHTGSFKPRGAFNRIVAAQEAGEVPAAGLIAAAGGNHRAAAAYAAAGTGAAPRPPSRPPPAPEAAEEPEGRRECCTTPSASGPRTGRTCAG